MEELDARESKETRIVWLDVRTYGSFVDGAMKEARSIRTSQTSPEPGTPGHHYDKSSLAQRS